MIPGVSETLDLSMAFVEGDTWGGIPTITIRIGEAKLPPDNDCSSAVLQFRKTILSRDVATQLSSDGGDIVITSASNWTFAVPAQNLPSLRSGSYVWAFRTTDISGAIQTYLEGSISVLPNSTRI